MTDSESNVGMYPDRVTQDYTGSYREITGTSDIVVFYLAISNRFMIRSSGNDTSVYISLYSPEEVFSINML